MSTPPATEGHRTLTQQEGDLLLFALDIAIAALDHHTFIGECLDESVEVSEAEEARIKSLKRLRRELTRKPPAAKPSERTIMTGGGL